MLMKGSNAVAVVAMPQAAEVECLKHCSGVRLWWAPI